MKSSKSFIGLIVVSTIFFIYASGVYKNLQSDSALEVVDFSIDGAKTDPASIKSNLDRSPSLKMILIRHWSTSGGSLFFD